MQPLPTATEIANNLTHWKQYAQSLQNLLSSADELIKQKHERVKYTRAIKTIFDEHVSKDRQFVPEHVEKTPHVISHWTQYSYNYLGVKISIYERYASSHYEDYIMYPYEVKVDGKMIHSGSLGTI